MASIVINGDTSGSVTLQAPATAGATVLTLPTTSGTVVTTSGAQTIEFADGSASTPSITNSGDTNTGMFFPAADTIAFAEGGTEAMRLDPSGNVGIGTTSPSERLTINGSVRVETAARGTVLTDNDLSFDMNASSNFKCTPTALGTLTFTNITSGQSGFVLLVNTGGYAISAAATTEVSSTTLTTISAAGTYLLSYFSDGTNVFVTNSGALA